MFYIEKRDLYNYITQTNLEEIADKDRFINDAISAAQQEVISYLSNFYDTDTIFRINGEILDFAIGTVYAVNQRIVWEVDVYVPASTYNTADYVSYDDGDHARIYKCLADGITGVWDNTKWTKLSENGSFYYCVLESLAKYPDNETYWTEGNPQNAKLRQVYCDLVIYSLHARVNPVQIPGLRTDRRDEAIDWLKSLNRNLKDDGIKADLPRHETYTAAENRPKIEYGSITKSNWR